MVPVKPRRRFGFFVCNRWRLPARGRNTLPLAVILNRLAADFFVFIPFGRRIIQSNFFEKERAIYGCGLLEARAISAEVAKLSLRPREIRLTTKKTQSGMTKEPRSTSFFRHSSLGLGHFRAYLPSVMLEGKPFSQLLGESHGRADRFSDSVVAQPLTPHAAATSSNAKNQ